MGTFQLFLLSGRTKDLSAPLYTVQDLQNGIKQENPMYSENYNFNSTLFPTNPILNALKRKWGLSSETLDPKFLSHGTICIFLIFFNLLKTTGYVMHQQVSNSTTVRSAHTVCVLYLPQNKQRLVPLTV